jgi:predicted amidohydrolase YtcJ
MTDIILHNAHIVTMDPLQPQAEALAVRDKRIFAVGAEADVLALARPGTKVVDLGGKTVWPGLCDAHIHLGQWSQQRLKLDCHTENKAACLERVYQRAAAQQPGTWVLGRDWDPNIWHGDAPRAGDLDAVAQGHLVFIAGKSLHTGWLNGAALHLLLSKMDPVAEEGSLFGRDPDGEFNGVIYEGLLDRAQELVPAPGLSERQRMLDRAQERLHRIGITAVHDFDGLVDYRALGALDEEGRLRLRAWQGIPQQDLPEARSMGLRSGSGSAYLRTGPAKLFADGALGSHTAALFEPDLQTGGTGVVRLDAGEIFDLSMDAHSAGFSLAVHAIGDRAVGAVLQAFARLRVWEEARGLPAAALRIEHAQLIRPEQVAEFARLGVLASMQPMHAVADRELAELAWGTRTVHAYAWREFRDAGVPLLFGSDAPVEEPNPFWGLYAAATRRHPQDAIGAGHRRAGWHTEQCLSLLDALAAYTLRPAGATSWGREIGRLAPGCFADLIILPDDPLQGDIDALPAIKPLATLIDGEAVW